MKAHVGIYPHNGRVAALYIYDDGRKEVKEYNVKEVKYIENIDIMYTNLQSKLEGQLGCACICLSPELEKDKNQFVILALKIGFEKAETINEDTANYIQKISELDFKIKPDWIIWICESNSIFIWKNNQCQEKISNQMILSNCTKEKRGKFLTEKPLSDVIICDENAWYFTEMSLNNIVPKRKFILHSKIAYKGEKMALTYAKVMAGEIRLYSQDIHDLDTNLPSPLTTIKRPIENKTDLLTKTLNKRINNDTISQSAPQKHHSYLFPNIVTSNSIHIDAIGIDLGTSKCCAAVKRKNGIETVALDYKGERLLPSYVAFDEENPKCGQLVIERLRHYAKSTVFDSKRIIGRNFNDIAIDSNWPYGLVEINNKAVMITKKVDRKEHVSAEEVAAILLKYIKEKCESFQGFKLNNVVVTVPAAFTDAQNEATVNATKLVGFTNIHLLPEPIAAAFAYFIDQPIPNSSNVLVFDLGGGTLDVCIFKIIDSQIQIISNTGDSKLGGRDFDTILINYFNNQLSTKYGVTLLNDRKYQLMTKCQKIKEVLSVMNESFMDIDEVDVTQKGVIAITRTEFQKMTVILLNRIRNTVNAALLNSNYTPNQINKVLQVGGGSRMPMIKELLLEIFPEAEHCCEEHPDEVVAIGAAYYAYSIFSK